MTRLPRPCPGPGDGSPCGVLIRPPAKRCPCCTRAYERRRGTVSERFGPGWGAISARILRRDNYTCHVCGRDGADTVDHLTPKSRFADPSEANHDSNLAACHRRCNSSKGTH